MKGVKGGEKKNESEEGGEGGRGGKREEEEVGTMDCGKKMKGCRRGWMWSGAYL